MEKRWFTWKELKETAQDLALQYSEAWGISFMGLVDTGYEDKTFGLHGRTIYGVCHITRPIERETEEYFAYLSDTWTVKFDELPYKEEGFESFVDIHNYIQEVLEQGREFHVAKYLKDVHNELRDIVVSEDRAKEEIWDVFPVINKIIRSNSESRDGIVVANILSYIDMLIAGRKEMNRNTESIEDLEFIKEQILHRARKTDTNLLDTDKLNKYYKENKKKAEEGSEVGREAFKTAETIEMTLRLLGIDTSILE